jgi:hypothetical protein
VIAGALREVTLPALVPLPTEVKYAQLVPLLIAAIASAESQRIEALRLIPGPSR